MAADRHEQEIRDLLNRRQPLPFTRAIWLLAELDATRLRLAALEVELDELRDRGSVAPSMDGSSRDEDASARLPEWLTVAEFAEAVGISTGLTYDLVRRKALKPVRRFGRLLRIHRDALQSVDRSI
jgi:excisionase family DNA binding protein